MQEIDTILQNRYKYVLRPNQEVITNTDKELLFPNIITDEYDFYERLKNDNIGIFKASDNKEYNLKELLLTRLSVLYEELLQYDKEYKSDTQKHFENIKEKLNVGIPLNELLGITDNTSNYIYNSNDISKIFKLTTGKEFTKENAEKFLQGELNLLLENDYTILTGKNPALIPNPPFIENNCNQPQNKRTTLKDNEKIMYAKIFNEVDKKMQDKLNSCLSSGKLLQAEANDKSSVLENLYKILTLPRADEINSKTILEECINILDNPYIITQTPEDIPEDYYEETIDIMHKLGNRNFSTVDIENRDVGTCAAASLEFFLASKHPAEFFRIIEGITSEKKEATKIIDCRRAGLTDDIIEDFRTPYKIDNGYVKIKLKADESSYCLAKLQNDEQDDDERTTTDILMQSLIFQIATKNTYNAITDKHADNFGHTIGLTDKEEQYALQILTGQTACNTTFEGTKLTIKESVIDSILQEGKYILVGIHDGEPNTSAGHKITLTGITKGIDGTEYYICKDTNAEFARPILIKKNYILEHILSFNYIK